MVPDWLLLLIGFLGTSIIAFLFHRFLTEKEHGLGQQLPPRPPINSDSDTEEEIEDNISDSYASGEASTPHTVVAQIREERRRFYEGRAEVMKIRAEREAAAEAVSDARRCAEEKALVMLKSLSFLLRALEF